jgi:hypothetical protein
MTREDVLQGLWERFLTAVTVGDKTLAVALWHEMTRVRLS